MPRPMYETATDRKNERVIAEMLERRWDCDADKLKIACEVDYSLTREGRIVAVMEIKCRNYDYDTLDGLGGLILSAHKWQAGRRWKETHNIAFILVLGLTDGVFVYRLKAEDPWPEMKLKTAGRRDRGDAQDIEPCVIIPMQKFQKLD